MRWHYFRREGNKLVLEDDAVLREQRPSDARPDDGNPHTPWHEDNEHFDEGHVHVRGVDAEHARMRAISMLLVGE